MNPAFWRGKRVFITGHTGFKGAWLCQLLQVCGAEVSGFALAPPTKPSLFELARVGELVSSTLGDIRELDALTQQLQRCEPEVVLHMAAQSVVLRSYEDPVENYSTNVLGTVHVLEALRRTGRPCVLINVTTDKVYENLGWIWGYRENDRLGGHDPYSNSKACAELIAQSYRDSFFPLERLGEHGVALASARAGNVIGGGDWTSRQLIPDVMAAFTRGEAVVLRHPQAVRPWQHVLDCLAGYLTLAEGLARDAAQFSGEWNFGPPDSDSRSVAYVVESLGRHWDRAQTWVQDPQSHAAEAQTLRLDVAKAAQLLQWRSQLRLDEALDWVAGWYRGLQRGEDARGLCRAQIDRYVNALLKST